MTQIIADRFLASGSTWLDLATGAHVRVHLAPAGPRSAQLLWSARCAAQANLRHPLLNALLDFGVVDQARTFEAYEVQGPVTAAGAAAQALLTHAVRFLEAHGIELTRPLADYALRPVVAGPPRRGTAGARALGVVLQRRPAFDAISDALQAVEPAGACAITILGPLHSGLRTMRIMAARAARLHGYVPASTSVLTRQPGAFWHLGGRHVCLLADADAGTAPLGLVTGHLARLQLEGGRRHMLLTFAREARAAGPAVWLDPMGATALTAMIFSERDFGPSPAEVFDAVRHADGRPGVLLAHLGARPLESCRPTPSLVRETAPSYLPPLPQARAAGRRRTAAVLLRSASRAHDLARVGRHAAAERLLARALRLLTARGERLDAARCAMAAGTLALDRGRVDAAVHAFEQARELAPDSRICVEATIGLGSAWTDGGRLIDAEGALRTALLAAVGLSDPHLAACAAAGLAECLRLQGRPREAAALQAMKEARPLSSAIASAAARVHIALGNIPSAVRAGRQAVEQSAGTRDARVITNAHRALAEALTAAGDCDAGRAEVHLGRVAARGAHLPLESLRLQIVELAALHDDPAARRVLAARLLAASRRRIPRLLRAELTAACARAAGEPLDRETRTYLQAAGASGLEQLYAGARGPVAELESLIELSHTAADDTAAIQAVCTELCDRLRALGVIAVSGGPETRVLAVGGRPWPGEPHVARRVLASGLGVAPDRTSEPAQAGEPVRYGGEVIAALAARWAAGSSIDADRAASLLRVGGLAVASSIRAVLDRAVARAPESRADDIIGDSPVVRGLRDAIARAARAPFPALIEGESGSGKELVARAIHRLGPRRDRRFCPVNCAALTDELLEAELFGHARGAFTGAVGERAGLFEDADGGTIFLDEIGELSARAQAKLLRVLQDGEVRRVGENVSRRVDVRVVAATNRRLAQETAAGRFRADLRFRLDVVRLEIPPLRERSGDVPTLAIHFWADAAGRVGSQATLAPEALAALSRYDWPGNVRELQNVMAWMAVHSPRRGRIGAAALPAHVAQAAAPCSGTFDAARQEFERRFVRAALAAANGQRASAAAAIGVSRQGLAKMLRRLGIESA